MKKTDVRKKPNRSNAPKGPSKGLSVFESIAIGLMAALVLLAALLVAKDVFIGPPQAVAPQPAKPTLAAPAQPTAAPTQVAPVQPTAAPAAAATPIPLIMMAPGYGQPINGGSGPTGAGANRDLPMTIAGRDFFAIGVEDLGDGWMRIREAGNRDFCAWSNQFKLQVSSGVAIQIPHCVEWRMTGTGNVKVTFKPDSVGYGTSDTLGTGLAWWPSGNNGSYRVTRDGNTTAWIPLTTGPEGVNFPMNGSPVTIEFQLENGYMAMPLGEIRNNVLPQY